MGKTKVHKRICSITILLILVCVLTGCSSQLKNSVIESDAVACFEENFSEYNLKVSSTELLVHEKDSYTDMDIAEVKVIAEDSYMTLECYVDVEYYKDGRTWSLSVSVKNRRVFCGRARYGIMQARLTESVGYLEVRNGT